MGGLKAQEDSAGAGGLPKLGEAAGLGVVIAVGSVAVQASGARRTAKGAASGLRGVGRVGGVAKRAAVGDSWAWPGAFEGAGHVHRAQTGPFCALTLMHDVLKPRVVSARERSSSVTIRADEAGSRA